MVSACSAAGAVQWWSTGWLSKICNWTLLALDTDYGIYRCQSKVQSFVSETSKCDTFGLVAQQYIIRRHHSAITSTTWPGCASSAHGTTASGPWPATLTASSSRQGQEQLGPYNICTQAAVTCQCRRPRGDGLRGCRLGVGKNAITVTWTYCTRMGL